MNFLITAGGTNEKIDDVRYITNHATGKLGKKIAEACLDHPEINVYYVYGQHAVLPNSHDRLHLFPIQSVNDLKSQLETLLTTKTFFAVIHSMAVSDYYVEKTFSETRLIESLTSSLTEMTDSKNFSQAIKQALTMIGTNQEKKISSTDDHLYVELSKAPKVISYIKKWQPTTKLVGFKLLVDVSKDHLVDIAYQQLQKNHCDYVLANDLITIHADSHIGLLVDSEKNYQTYTTKSAIAQGIVAHLLNAEETPDH